MEITMKLTIRALIIPLLLTCLSCAVKIEKDTHKRDLTNTPKYLVSEKKDKEYLSIIAEVPQRQRATVVASLIAQERKLHKKRCVRDAMDAIANAPAAARSTMVHRAMSPLKLTMHLGKKHSDMRELSATSRTAYKDFLAPNPAFSPTEIYFSKNVFLFAKAIYLGAHPKSGKTLLGQVIERELSSIRSDFPGDSLGIITADRMYECMITADSVIFETGASFPLSGVTSGDFQKEFDEIRENKQLYDSLLHSYRISESEFTPAPPGSVYIGIARDATARSVKTVVNHLNSLNQRSIIFSGFRHVMENSESVPARRVKVTEKTISFDDKFQFHYVYDTIYPGWVKTAVSDSLGNILSFPTYSDMPLFDSLGNIYSEDQDSGFSYIISYDENGVSQMRKEFSYTSMGTLELPHLVPSMLYFSYKEKNSSVEFEFSDSVSGELIRDCMIYSFGVPYQLK